MSIELMSLKATNGTIIAYDDCVVVKRKGVFALSSHGIVGDVTYFYKNLSAVEYKRPGLVNGYLKFISAGTPFQNSSIKTINEMLSTPKKISEDENTVLLRAFKKDTPTLCDKMYQLIKEKISESQAVNPPINTSLSVADEIQKLKSLLDNGIISQQEFESQKKKLLK